MLGNLGGRPQWEDKNFEMITTPKQVFLVLNELVVPSGLLN